MAGIESDEESDFILDSLHVDSFLFEVSKRFFEDGPSAPIWLHVWASNAKGETLESS